MKSIQLKNNDLVICRNGLVYSVEKQKSNFSYVFECSIITHKIAYPYPVFEIIKYYKNSYK